MSRGQGLGVYVASRASLPERPAYWRRLREEGYQITSSWIDEAPAPPLRMGELWQKMEQEIAGSVGVLLYAETEDFPLKGALIECGMALGMGKPVALVLPGVEIQMPSFRPLGSWACHPRVQQFDSVEAAYQWLRRGQIPQG